MKIVFLSNYFNHHQKALCNALYKHNGSEFSFIQTSEMREERKKLGYGRDIIPDYVLKYDADTSVEIAEKVMEADVVIIGSAPDSFIKERLAADKLILRYSERPLKKGLEIFKYIPRYIRWHKNNPIRKQIYLLCASAYTYSDFRKFGLFKNKAYKWGYFPEAKEYQEIDSLIEKKNKNEILWCGRFLDWKHPDDVIEVARRLVSENYSFNINIIGRGEMEDILCDMVKKYDLENYVHFLGSMTPENVRLYMERAGIYLFTSDRGEGWGAVLNESMNSGCAVVASHMIGSVPFLIKDEKNGMIYESGNVDMLYDKVKYLLDRPEYQDELGRNAYDTIINEWNADVAADRLMILSNKLSNINDNENIFDEGVCSKAYAISERYHRRKNTVHVSR